MSMPRSYEELWAVIEPVVVDEGLRLFDLLVPSDRRQPLKVFIAQQALKSSGVSVDNCAKVHRRLIDMFEAQYGEEWNGAMEVSSPGVNRRLSRPEHFSAAIGERIRVILRSEDGSSEVLRGELKAYANSGLEVCDEESGVARSIPLAAVEKAQVDFLFDSRRRE